MRPLLKTVQPELHCPPDDSYYQTEKMGLCNSGAGQDLYFYLHITHFLDICAPEFDFRKKLKDLMNMARKTQLPSMGFPVNWEEEELFQKD